MRRDDSFKGIRNVCKVSSTFRLKIRQEKSERKSHVLPLMQSTLIWGSRVRLNYFSEYKNKE